MLLDRLAIAIAPKLLRQAADGGIARGKARQAGGLEGVRAKHSGACFHQLFDFGEQLRRHGVRFRQDQEPIAGAIGQDDSSVFNRHARQHDLRRATVEVVAWPFSGLARHLPLLGTLLGGHVTNIGDEKSLLEEVLAA